MTSHSTIEPFHDSGAIRRSCKRTRRVCLGLAAEAFSKTAASPTAPLTLVGPGLRRARGDCGPGTFARLGKSKFSMAKVDVVSLTHLHIDHAGELPGLFKDRVEASDVPTRFQVFGPAGHKAAAPT